VGNVTSDADLLFTDPRLSSVWTRVDTSTQPDSRRTILPAGQFPKKHDVAMHRGETRGHGVLALG
jgi:hypothetical protein